MDLTLRRLHRNVFDITAYGAQPEITFDNSQAIQAAIAACSAAGGGTVRIPAPHTFMSGPLTLCSHLVLLVEAGATLLANPDEQVYTQSAFRTNPGEGTMWLSAENVQHLTITGGGRIDGNGLAFMGDELADSYELKPFDTVDPRPHVLTIIGGQNIRIHDIHIGNSAYWTIHLAGCSVVEITRVTIRNSVKVRNSDGIDIDHSKNVRVRDCHIESGDDCVCLKNRREYDEFGACEDISVSHCTMTSSSCAIKIGSENMDAIRRVRFEDCVITDSNRGVGIQNRDEGTVEDIIFSRLTIESRLFSDVWWGKSEPIYVTAYKRANGNDKDANWRFPAGVSEGRVGAVRGITFRAITGMSENGVYVSAEAIGLISDIRFERVDLTISHPAVFRGGVYDRRPCAAIGLFETKTAGFYIEKAAGITIENSQASWATAGSDFFAATLVTDDVRDLRLINFLGTTSHVRTDFAPHLAAPTNRPLTWLRQRWQR